ncbi:hypothetical protein ACL6C3_23525 [Capilliphycus salinus ALCB114379]|uniref:hypothetical protein n=1 Tax=Capilliphycus salinus TaxID=2768948 RepID=UPI0039A6A62B
MNKPLASRYSRFISSEEQQIYDHLLERVELETPSELIERIRLLFIEGSGYPDRQIAHALEKILNTEKVEEDFHFIINRCCYILINRWHTLPNRKTAIYELLQLLDKLTEKTLSNYNHSRRLIRLQKLMQNFAKSEEYLALKRFAEVLCQSSGSNYRHLSSQPLRTLIPRYPYLYSHCLLSDYSSYEHKQMIRHIQTQKQRKFELDLSRYSAHQIRRLEVAKISLETAKKIKSPLDNPTLLNNRELFTALKQFVGKVEGSETYRDQAQRFLTYSSSTQSFRAFKQDFYEYLNPTSFGSSYSKRQFSDKLYKQLKMTIPHSEDEPFNEFLLLRTCSQMLNFLVVESPQRPNHFVFIDLIGNVGPTYTVGLLLKIVLICRQVKPYLEKRFSILFNHYESSPQDGVQWLVKVLENLNIALTTNFGRADLSFIH